MSFVKLCQLIVFLLVLRTRCGIWARGYKTFFMLNSVEYKILNAHGYKNITKFGLYLAQISLECYFSRL